MCTLLFYIAFSYHNCSERCIVLTKVEQFQVKIREWTAGNVNRHLDCKMLLQWTELLRLMPLTLMLRNYISLLLFEFGRRVLHEDYQIHLTRGYNLENYYQKVKRSLRGQSIYETSTRPRTIIKPERNLIKFLHVHIFLYNSRTPFLICVSSLISVTIYHLAPIFLTYSNFVAYWLYQTFLILH